MKSETIRPAAVCNSASAVIRLFLRCLLVLLPVRGGCNDTGITSREKFTYPPRTIRGESFLGAVQRAEDYGIYLKADSDSAEIGTGRQSLTFRKNSGGVWVIQSLKYGGATVELNQASFLGGMAELEIPLTRLKKIKDTRYEKSFQLTGQKDDVKVAIVFRVSWQGDFITTDVSLTTPALPMADFFIGFTFPGKTELPVVDVLAPPNLGHEWVTVQLPDKKRFMVDFTVFPGFAVHNSELNLRMTCVMDYGYTDFRKPPPEQPLNYMRTKRELAFTRTLWRHDSDKLTAGYSWRPFPLAAGTYKTRIHWYFDREDSRPAPKQDHLKLVTRTLVSLYDERLNRAEITSHRDLAENFLERISQEDCRFEYEGRWSLVEIPGQFPKREMDLQGHAYFSTVWTAFGQNIYNNFFGTEHWMPEYIWDDIGKVQYPTHVQFPYELLMSLQLKGLNSARQKVYDRELSWLQSEVKFAGNPDFKLDKLVFSRRPDNFHIRPEPVLLRNNAVLFQKPYLAMVMDAVVPGSVSNINAVCAAAARIEMQNPGDTFLMQNRGNTIRLYDRALRVFDKAYLDQHDPVFLSEGLRLASEEISYRHCYDDYYHNLMSGNRLIAPYLDERSMVRGEDNYNDQYSIAETAFILRWDCIFRRTDEIVPFLVELFYLRNSMPFSFKANLPVETTEGQGPEKLIDHVACEFLPQLGRIGRIRRSAIYQSVCILHSAMAFEGYAADNQKVLSYLTGTHTADTYNGYDHVILWNTDRLESQTTDIVGRFVTIKGLVLEPWEIKRVIIKKTDNTLRAILPGNSKKITFSSRALSFKNTAEKEKKTYVIRGVSGEPSETNLNCLPDGESFSVIFSSDDIDSATTELNAFIASDFGPPRNETLPVLGPAEPVPGNPAVLRSSGYFKEPQLTYRSFSLTGHWADPVGGHEQVKATADSLENVILGYDEDHSLYVPVGSSGGREVCFKKAEDWELAIKEEYWAGSSETNHIDYKINAGFPVQKLSIDLDAKLLGIKDMIQVFLSTDNGKTFLLVKRFENPRDYEISGSFSYDGFLIGRQVLSLDAGPDKLKGSSQIIIRIVLANSPGTRFYNINYSAFGKPVLKK